MRSPARGDVMPLTFKVLESSCCFLWTFAWFDVTRFAIEGPAAERADVRDVLRSFFADPISQRAYCDQEGWGVSGHHGPFVHGVDLTPWFRIASHADVTERIHAVLDDPLSSPLSPDERAPLLAWLERVRSQGHDLLRLDDDVPQRVKIEWHYIWTFFHEFAALDRERNELEIAVLGLD